MNITAKEMAVLEAIDNSEYGDEITDPIWTWSVWDNIDTDIVSNQSSLGGIFASLNKKGLIYSDADSGHGDDDASCGMTNEGAQAYIAAKGKSQINKWHEVFAPVEEMQVIWDNRRAAKQAAKEAAQDQVQETQDQEEILFTEGSMKCTVKGDECMMTGGKFADHTIYVPKSDEQRIERIKAHWEGYIQANTLPAELRKTVAIVEGPEHEGRQAATLYIAHENGYVETFSGISNSTINCFSSWLAAGYRGVHYLELKTWAK